MSAGTSRKRLQQKYKSKQRAKHDSMRAKCEAVGVQYDGNCVGFSFADPHLQPVSVHGNPMVSDLVRSAYFRNQVAQEAERGGVHVVDLEWGSMVLNPTVASSETRVREWREEAVSKDLLLPQVIIPVREGANSGRAKLVEQIQKLSAPPTVVEEEVVPPPTQQATGMAEIMRTMKQFRSDLASQETEIKALKTASLAQQKINDELHQTIDAQQKAIDELRQTIDELRQTIDELRQTIDAQQTTIWKLDTKITDQGRAIQNLIATKANPQDVVLRQMLELYRDKLVQEHVPESITTLVEKIQYLRRTLTDEFEKWVLKEYKVVSKRIRGTPSVAEMRDAIRHRETASNEMYQELFDHVEALAS